MIVLAESVNDAEISMDDVVGCSTVADLLRIAGVDGTMLSPRSIRKGTRPIKQA